MGYNDTKVEYSTQKLRVIGLNVGQCCVHGSTGMTLNFYFYTLLMCKRGTFPVKNAAVLGQQSEGLKMCRHF